MTQKSEIEPRPWGIFPCNVISANVFAYAIKEFFQVFV